MQLYKCDRCGKIADKTRPYCGPENWRTINYKVSYCNPVTYNLCEECSKALQLPEDVQTQDVGDRLLEIIEELIDERIQQ